MNYAIDYFYCFVKIWCHSNSNSKLTLNYARFGEKHLWRLENIALQEIGLAHPTVQVVRPTVG